MTEPDPLQECRDKLVMAALAHVPFDGWSRLTLREAAKDAGFDVTMAERAFPGGPVAAVEHFAALADRRLAEEATGADLEGLRLSERIVWLVKLRLEPWVGHREAIRRAISLLSLPMNTAAALRMTWRTADALWYATGDASADFSFYTKRAMLAVVYASTLLYWLEDASPGFADSWAFLNRRVADATKLTKLRVRASQRLQHLPNPFDLLSGKRPGRRRFAVRRG
jgi:ubiquinone biosynthesis protein COQ9